MSPRLIEYLYGQIWRRTMRLTLRDLSVAAGPVTRIDRSLIRTHVKARATAWVRQETIPPVWRGAPLTDDAVFRAAMVRRFAERCLDVCESPEQVHRNFLQCFDDDFVRRRLVTPRSPEDPNSGEARDVLDEQGGVQGDEVEERSEVSDVWKAAERASKELAQVMRLHPAAGELIHARLTAPAENGKASPAYVFSWIIGSGMLGQNKLPPKRGRRVAKPTSEITTWIWTIEALRQLCGTSQAQARAMWASWFPDVTSSYDNARDCSRWHARVLAAYQAWDALELQQYLRKQQRVS